MVHAGMTPMAAIRVGHGRCRDAAGQGRRPSAPSKRARMPTSSRSTAIPLANVRELESVDFVMKQGRVHKLGGERVLTEKVD